MSMQVLNPILQIKFRNSVLSLTKKKKDKN